ncbi:unnamed protein product [Rhizophagus irregularis]|nr:unnamed protein product [Rhizophagus irregularis]
MTSLGWQEGRGSTVIKGGKNWPVNLEKIFENITIHNNTHMTRREYSKINNSKRLGFYTTTSNTWYVFTCLYKNNNKIIIIQTKVLCSWAFHILNFYAIDRND